MGKRNISRLTPIKKSVIDPRSSSTDTRTYYIDPNKENGQAHTKRPHQIEDIPHKKGPEENDTHSVKLTPQEKVGDFSDVKDFEDFGKKGIDPDAARTFFCRM